MTPAHRDRPAAATTSADVWIVVRHHSAPQGWSAAQGALAEHRAAPLPGDVADQLRAYLTAPGPDPVTVEVTWGLFRLGHLLPAGARPVGVIVEGHYCGSDWLGHLDPPPEVLAELLAVAASTRHAALREVATCTVQLPAAAPVLTLTGPADAEALPGYLARVAELRYAPAAG